jgi:hypothetical protein
MGILSSADKEAIGRGAWANDPTVPPEHQAIYIYVDGRLRYTRLTRAQARIYWRGLNIGKGHAAHMRDAKNAVLAVKTEHEMQLPAWW